MQRRPLTLSSINIPQNLLILHLAVLRSLMRRLPKVITNGDFLHLRSVCRNKLVVYIFVDVDSCPGVAGLTEVHVDGPHGPVDRLLNVGVGKDNVGTLSAEFKGYFLEVGVRCCSEDGTAGGR
jgi:hypothetical protein